jgi:hypothetical protein
MARMLVFAILGLLVQQEVALATSPGVRIGDATFRIGMSQAQALSVAKQSLVVLPIQGTPQFFLYGRGATGQLATDYPLGALRFSGGILTSIRRELGTLESKEAVMLGRRIAASIIDSGYEAKQNAVLNQSYHDQPNFLVNTIKFNLPDRMIRIQVFEGRGAGTTSSLNVTEHFGQEFDPLE